MNKLRFIFKKLPLQCTITIVVNQNIYKFEENNSKANIPIHEVLKQ